MFRRLLPVAVVLLTIVSWISTAILVRHALHKPRVGALTERAILAVIISITGTLSIVVLVVATGEMSEPARNVLRLAMLALLGVPSYWTYLYYSGRLGPRK